MTEVRVTGIPEALAHIRKMGEQVQAAASVAVVSTALDIQAEAKRNTPVDTGRLRNSIAVAQDPAEASRNSDAATEAGEASNAIQKGMLSAVIGTNVNYAPKIHEGTRFIAPRPFLRNALEANRGKLLDELRTLIAEATR